MKTHSFGWTDQLGGDLARAAPRGGFTMSLVGEDRAKVIAAINQGIDAHLEACFVPARGDQYYMRMPPGIHGRVSGPRLECRVSPTSLPVLVRRLLESEDDAAESLASAICSTLQIEFD